MLTILFYEKQRKYIKMLEFSIDKIFVMFGGHVFQDSRFTHGNKMRSSSRRLVSLFISGRLHTGRKYSFNLSFSLEGEVVV
jgi:hypothetical protein